MIRDSNGIFVINVARTVVREKSECVSERHRLRTPSGNRVFSPGKEEKHDCFP